MSFIDPKLIKKSGGGGGGGGDALPLGTIIQVHPDEVAPAEYIPPGRYQIDSYPELSQLPGYPHDVGAAVVDTAVISTTITGQAGNRLYITPDGLNVIATTGGSTPKHSIYNGASVTAFDSDYFTGLGQPSGSISQGIPVFNHADGYTYAYYSGRIMRLNTLDGTSIYEFVNLSSYFLPMIPGATTVEINANSTISPNFVNIDDQNRMYFHLEASASGTITGMFVAISQPGDFQDYSLIEIPAPIDGQPWTTSDSTAIAIKGDICYMAVSVGASKGYYRFDMTLGTIENINAQIPFSYSDAGSFYASIAHHGFGSDTILFGYHDRLVTDTELLQTCRFSISSENYGPRVDINCDGRPQGITAIQNGPNMYTSIVGSSESGSQRAISIDDGQTFSVVPMTSMASDFAIYAPELESIVFQSKSTTQYKYMQNCPAATGTQFFVPQAHKDTTIHTPYHKAVPAPE